MKMLLKLVKLMNNGFIHIHLDRSHKQAIPDHIKNDISLQFGGSDQDSEKIFFCGFLFKGSEAHVFMPRGTNTKQNKFSNIELARLLFKCLTKFCRANKSFLQKEGKSTVVGELQVLPLISDILDDYKVNGIYTSQNLYTRKGFQGKTDWKKTIARINPYLEGSAVIYPHFINSFTNSFNSNEVTQIHYSILHEIQERFAWLFPELDMFTFQQKTSLNNPTSDLKVIKAELSRTYSDAKIHTLKLLLKFLENDYRSANTESISYGFKDFHFVWENMLRNVLRPIYPFPDIPIPAYLEHSGREVSMPRKGQRMDIVLYEKTNKQAYVIDAKYYDGSSIDLAPGWPDLVKQFFYAKSLTAGNLKNMVNSVKNFFIFPGATRSTSPQWAFVKDSSGRLDTEFPPINCIHVTPEEVIDCYVSNKPLIGLRQQIIS
jgi:hypothetical protein